jgi:hypothetical protein
VAEIFGDGRPRLVYAAQTDTSEDYYNPTTESVGTIELVGLGAGETPALGTLGAALWTRTAADSQGLVGNGPADPLRIVGVGDLNGDGLTDVALEATFVGYSSSEPTEYIQASFTQVIQRAGGGFFGADTHWTTTGSVFDETEPAGGIDMDVPLFTLADVRRNGRLDLFEVAYARSTFGYTDLTRPSLMALANTSEWKAPVVIDGDGVLMVRAVSAEMVRGATVAHVRVYRDSNGSGTLDTGDELLGEGGAAAYLNYPDQAGATWRFELGGVTGSGAVFVQAEDSMGTLSEPFRVA